MHERERTGVKGIQWRMIPHDELCRGWFMINYPVFIPILLSLVLSFLGVLRVLCGERFTMTNIGPDSRGVTGQIIDC